MLLCTMYGINFDAPLIIIVLNRMPNIIGTYSYNIYHLPQTITIDHNKDIIAVCKYFTIRNVLNHVSKA